jgi:hypothetical protein
LADDEQLHEMFSTQIANYMENGYAIPAPTGPISGPLWYLPHHAVTHPRKPGKVRVVFDAAAEYRGSSLNDNLLSGPDLNSNLTEVLIRFRQHPVAISADIKAMFHQVAVEEKDHNALRFLWWPEGDLNLTLQEYCMTRHVFGLTSSPSCAVFALQRTAKDYGASFSNEAVTSIFNNFYVYDFLKSMPNEREAALLAAEMRELLRLGGFELTKWASNRPEALRQISDLIITDVKDHCSTLGLKWDSKKDAFSFEEVCSSAGINCFQKNNKPFGTPGRYKWAPSTVCCFPHV